MSDPTQGNPSPKEGQAEGDNGHKYVTEEQLNRAITARFGAFEKTFEKRQSEQLKTHFGEFSTKLVEEFGSKFQAPTAGSNESKKDDDSPAFKGLQKQLAEQKAAMDRVTAQLEAERTQKRDMALRQKVSEELARVGIDGVRAQHALGFLVDHAKRVRYTDDGDEVVFRDVDGSDLDIATGLKSWAKTEDAKLYLPPRGASGSGDRGGGQSGRSGKPNQLQPGELGAAIANMFGDTTSIFPMK